MNFFITICLLLMLSISKINSFLNTTKCTPAFFFDTTKMNCTSCLDTQNPEEG